MYIIYTRMRNIYMNTFVPYISYISTKCIYTYVSYIYKMNLYICIMYICWIHAKPPSACAWYCREKQSGVVAQNKRIKKKKRKKRGVVAQRWYHIYNIHTYICITFDTWCIIHYYIYIIHMYNIYIYTYIKYA